MADPQFTNYASSLTLCWYIRNRRGLLFPFRGEAAKQLAIHPDSTCSLHSHTVCRAALHCMEKGVLDIFLSPARVVWRKDSSYSVCFLYNLVVASSSITYSSHFNSDFRCVSYSIQVLVISLIKYLVERARCFILWRNITLNIMYCKISIYMQIHRI